MVFHYTEIKSKLLTITYKVRHGWFGLSNLSLLASLFPTLQTCLFWSLGLRAFVLALYLYSSVHIHFSQISSWWSASYHSDLSSNHRAIQWPALTIMAEAEAPTHSSNMVLFFFFKTLISIWNQFICSYVYHMNTEYRILTHQSLSFISSRT